MIGKQLIFLYVNEYRLSHTTIPTPDEFELVQADYDDFVKFISDKDYDYTTSSERLLKDLEDSAKEEKYLEEIQEDLDNLTSKIKHDKQKDLYKFQEEIEQLLAAVDLSKPEGHRNRAIVETLYACGLRVSELTNLKISNHGSKNK